MSDKQIHPLLRDLLVGLGRIGTRAMSRGAQSVAKDVDSILGEGRDRLRRFVDGVEELVSEGEGDTSGDDSTSERNERRK